MSERTVRRILTFIGVALVFAAIAFAQPSATVQNPIGSAENTWNDAQSISPSPHKLYVVTVDQPDRKKLGFVQR